jgi:hypothetical protein
LAKFHGIFERQGSDSGEKLSRSRFLLLWRWRRYIPPKRRVFLLEAQGVISQKITFLIITTVKNYSRRHNSTITMI